jgi:hypothetical protein
MEQMVMEQYCVVRPILRAVCEGREIPTVSADILKSGAPGEIRTPDPLLRRHVFTILLKLNQN